MHSITCESFLLNCNFDYYTLIFIALNFLWLLYFYQSNVAAALVAGAFLSATIQTIAEKLSSTEFRGFVSNTKFNYSLLEELKTTLFTLQAVLVDAEPKQFNDLPVKQWLDDLKDAIFYSEDLLNLIIYDALRCKVENTPVDQLQNLSSSIKINSKMEKMCKRLQTFVQQKDIIGLQRTVSGRVSRRTPSSSVVNESVKVGRNDDKDRLIDVLVSDWHQQTDSSMCCCNSGYGRCRKKTLAQLVYNDEKVEKHFDLKAWVYVSEDFDVVRVTKSLLESVVRNTTSTASKVWESDNLDILRVELMKQLMDRRFLFVLDDLWNDNYIDWNELVTPLFKGTIGSKVIITTREQKVADVARTFPIHKLEPMSDEDCWSFLSMHAIGGEYLGRGKYPKIEAIGRKISRKCNGLPIAAKALGGLMRSKVDEKEWNAILNSDIWKLQNDKNSPRFALELSISSVSFEEEKQINNPSVKQWLDDLKDAVFDAEDLLNQISYDSLRCKVENAQVGNKTNQVWNFLSSPFKNFYRDINFQMKIMCESLQLFAQHKDILGLQTKSARVSRRTPSSSVVNESFMVGRKDEKET
ncbi:unnamed protein product [Trifolium pratense]|uniref:Uncharacterized protein n=1 Tax=Trifolium pratense TaxID=57577 RepID=A0ACB0J456_TRIPR|nr:unnamed protein product [Trifolium pratense]